MASTDFVSLTLVTKAYGEAPRFGDDQHKEHPRHRPRGVLSVFLTFSEFRHTVFDDAPSECYLVPNLGPSQFRDTKG